MPYKATAQLQLGSIAVTINGITTTYKINTPVQATATGLTRLLAQQNARKQCNFIASQLLHKQAAEISTSSGAFKNAVLSSNYIFYITSKITEVCQV